MKLTNTLKPCHQPCLFLVAAVGMIVLEVIVAGTKFFCDCRRVLESVSVARCIFLLLFVGSGH